MIGGVGGEEAARSREAGRGEERIRVSVRLRPLNAKEIERNDPADWECINDTTVSHKQSLLERSLFPQAYTFDRVFEKECSTRHVYLEGAKEVALSVVSGINASIFAYGQTSSGKTYTMTGITEYTVEDIYEHMSRHEEREFMLKFSAMEIYNEAVRDLLSADTAPLRLLDDPVRGTVVEKLREETLRDRWHLRELIEICAAQRQVEETALNEMSSRSHQILRLTIESTAKEFKDKGSSSSLFAAVNFVDLAGSERAYQALSGSNRLKEGCHINRSLLTLGTVIRKLSKGRTGHIPYRDSKLTRIMQPFLGRNARTAIICTMSPARSHMEQSRNTLLFASCAKEVVTNAKANVVMSDKALVKHLQRELARLANEMKYPGFSTCTEHSDVLKDKDAQIRKMEREIKELMQQRDLAQSRLNDLLQVVVDVQFSRQWEVSRQASRQWEASSPSSASHTRSQSEDILSVSGLSSTGYQIPDFVHLSFEASGEFSKCNHQLELPVETRKSPLCSIRSPSSNKLIPMHEGKEIAEDRHEDLEDDRCKEVQCIEMHAGSPARRSGEFKLADEDKPEDFASRSEADKNEDLEHDLVESRDLALTKSRSCKAILMDSSLVLSLPEDDELRDKDASAQVSLEEPTRKPEVIEIAVPELNGDEKNKEPSVEGLETSEEGNSSDMIEAGDAEIANGKVDCNETTHLGTNEGDNNHQEHQEQVSSGTTDEGESKHQKQLSFDEEIHQNQLETHEDCVDDGMPCSIESSLSKWELEFQGKQQEIIQLWQICNVPLVHRTCFFLLFKGEPADSVYMEVEFRRLSFLKNTFSRGIAADIMLDGGHNDVNSSLRYLRREKEMLCKQMQRTMTPQERERLYIQWGIDLNSKQRRLQLIQLLWAKTDVEHARESASAVAKVIGFVERGQGQGMKEMVGLCLTTERAPKRSFTWMPSRSSYSRRLTM